MDEGRRKLIKGALLLAAASATPESLIMLAQTAGKPIIVNLKDGNKLEITGNKVFLLKDGNRTPANGTFEILRGNKIVAKKGVFDGVKGGGGYSSAGYDKLVIGFEKGLKRDRAGMVTKTWKIRNLATGELQEFSESVKAKK